MKFKPAFLVLAAFFTANCTSNTEVEIQTPLTSDSSYADAFDKYTRSTEVYNNFEAKFSLHATYLSPEFRKAFAERLKNLYTQNQPSLDEAGNKAGFFITIAAPEDEDMDLGNSHLWTLVLENDDGSMPPVLVKRLAQKKRWTPFFTKVNKWSREYLVLFDTPSITPTDEEMVKERIFNLIMANADAKVKLKW